MSEIVDRETEAEGAGMERPSLDQAHAPEPPAVDRLLSVAAMQAMTGAADVLGEVYAPDSAVARALQVHKHTQEALRRHPSLKAAGAAAVGTAWSRSDRRLRSIQEFALVSNETVKAIGAIARAWSPVLEGMSSGIQKLGRNAEAWERRLSLVGESIAHMQRKADAVAAPVRLVVTEIHDRLRMVQAVVQSPAFQAWAQELSNERVQDGLLRLLDEARENDEPALDATVAVSEEASSEAVEDVRLFAWIASLLRRINALGISVSHRWEIFSLLVTFALFTYSEMGSDADHAELLSTLRQQHQEQTAQGALQNQDTKELVAALHALASLQQVDQRFEVSVDAAPMRTERSGPVARRLKRGEEVQVLAAVGKWRRVQGVDEEGALFYGWVMNKHLDEVLPHRRPTLLPQDVP